MQGKLSRRKLATYVADRVENGVVPDVALLELAGYLIETGRQRELTLVVRAIEDVLEQRGIVVATITSARPLDETTKQDLTGVVTSSEVHLREVIDPSVIGGARLQTPSATLDTTIAHKLTLLQSAKA